MAAIRVTERSRIDAIMTAQNRAATRLDRAARVASSGMRVQKPSDDPAAYASKIRRDHTLAMLEEHSKNATRAANELQVVQSSLDAAIDIMSRAQAAAVNGANATTDGNARKLLAEDVRTMRSELMSIANTRYGDRYLFGGTRTDTMPFDPATGAFAGNDQVIRVPVLDGVAPPANVSGAKTFTTAGGRDLFADLDALAKALDANDETAIRAALGALPDGHAQLVKAQVEAGFGAERFQSALDVLMTTKTAVVEGLASDIEGDPAAHLTELTLARTAYEQTIGVTKELLSISSMR